MRQYVCSGVREDGRAVNLTWAMGWTSAAIVKVGHGVGAIETWYATKLCLRLRIHDRLQVHLSLFF